MDVLEGERAKASSLQTLGVIPVEDAESALARLLDSPDKRSISSALEVGVRVNTSS